MMWEVIFCLLKRCLRTKPQSILMRLGILEGSSVVAWLLSVLLTSITLADLSELSDAGRIEAFLLLQIDKHRPSDMCRFSVYCCCPSSQRYYTSR